MNDSIRPALTLLISSTMLAPACVTTRPVDPELVRLEATLGQELLAAARTNETSAVLRVEASAPAEKERPPLHIAVVIDASGSMKGEAIARARDGAIALIDRLGGSDRITVVAFSTEVEVLAEGDEIEDTDLVALRARLAKLEAVGTTNLSGGLAAALRMLQSSTDTVRRVVLLSDGRPNTPGAVEPQIMGLAQASIPVTALGLGLDYDEVLLARLAQETGGAFTFVETPAMLAKVFEDEVMRLDRVVARTAHLTITPGPGVRVLRVEGQPAQVHEDTFTVTLGDLFAGESREVVLAIQTDSRRADVTLEMFDAVLTFDDAIANTGRLTRRRFVSATTTMDEARVEASKDLRVLGAAARARAGSVALDAIALARNGQHAAAEQLLDTAIAAADEAGALEDPRLAEAIQNLRQLRENLPVAATQAHLESAGSAARNKRAHNSAWSYTY